LVHIKLKKPLGELEIECIRKGTKGNSGFKHQKEIPWVLAMLKVEKLEGEGSYLNNKIKTLEYEKRTRAGRKKFIKKAAKRVKKAGDYKAPPVSWGGGRV